MAASLISSQSLYISELCCMVIKSSAPKMKRRRGTRRMKKRMVLLPQELIIQILLRLPVKSLVRFKCVSKFWLSLISDPNFALSHFELASAPTQRLMLLEPFVPEVRSIDFNASLHDYSASDALNLKFPIPHHGIIVGSSRGLLLFNCSPNLYLWNPSTGVHRQIPSSPIESNLEVDAMFFTFLYGFGYDPSTDDYLVVRASYDPSAAVVITHVELFSFRANKWKEMEGTHLSYINDCDDHRLGLVLNGAIHWLTFCVGQDVNVIVAFDLTERSFSEIPLPHDFYYDSNWCDLWAFGGCLSLWVMENDATVIWVMEEYKVHASWTKTIAVSYDGISTQSFSPVCSSKNGDIVGTDGATGLVKCDERGQLLEYCTYSDNVRGCYVAMYSESLLPLPGDSEQGEQDDL